jgi:hypothetical protein
MAGRCSCGARTESSSGLCPACIARGQTLYYSSSAIGKAEGGVPDGALLARADAWLRENRYAGDGFTLGAASLIRDLREALASAPPSPPRLRVSELREGEENDGALESTDLFLEGDGWSLLVNIPAGSHATYTLCTGGRCEQSGEVEGAAPPAGEAEQCICAAIMLPNGEVWRGHRHSDAIQTAGKAGATREDVAEAEQGFITSRNRFVGREEGAVLQARAGIVSAQTGKLPEGMLFSEDLYLRAWRATAGAPAPASPHEEA